MYKIDIFANLIEIKGNILNLNSDLLFYLTRNFDIATQTQDAIVLKNKYDNEEAIKKIEKGFKHYNIEYVFSDVVKEQQNNYFLEEKKFKDFSQKAKDIRNNICDAKEFEEFKNILVKYMPNRRLYGLQFLSAYHLAFAQNACNFSVPGAGKTSIVYGAYTYLKNLPENNYKYVNRILVIGPLNSFEPWEEEFKDCFGYDVDSKRIVNMSEREREQYFQGHIHSELTLVSYMTAANSYDDIIAFLKNENVMVVLDEAHKIKNTSNEAQIAPAILKLAPYAKARVILTGTPIPNGYADLYNLYKFIWPKNDVIKYKLFQLNQMSMTTNLTHNKEMVNKLINNISPFFIRIKKDDFENMPIPIENPLIRVEMDKDQYEIYNFIEKNYIKSIDTNMDVSSITKAKIIRLMQAATNPQLLRKPIEEIYGENIKINDAEILNKILKYNRLPNKFLKCVELVKKILESPNEKVVIWAYYIDNLLLLKDIFKEENMECETLYGKTPIESDFDEGTFNTREKIVRKFNDKNSGLRILIANPFAASESISLHKCCHNAIYIERNFNAAIYIQSKDRIHRYGLKKDDKINYYYLGSKDTIDDVIDDRLKFKEKRMKELIESEEIPLFSNYFYMDVEKDDVKEILKKYVDRRI